MENQLLEDEVIKILDNYLRNKGWRIKEINYGHDRGIDIKAVRDNLVLIVEAKGVKGNPKSHLTTRSQFDSGQLKTHLGKAIVKVLEEKNKNSSAIISIALPNNNYLKEKLKYVIPEIKKIGIKLFFVNSDGTVIEN